MRKTSKAARMTVDGVFLRAVFALTLLTVAVCCCALAKAATPLGANVSVLDDATIVDTKTGSLHRHMAILIRGGRIAKIAPAHSLKADSASTVDLHGKYVVPGYLDMHNHALNSAGPDISLSLMVANGITGFRQMAGSPELLAARKNGTLLHPDPSPELLAMPGSVLAGPWKGDVPAVIAQVDAQKAQGADFIKTVDQTHDAFFAALDRAHADGLPFGGHLPPSVDVREAAHRGMWSIEHLGPNGGILEACSSDEAAIRQDYAQSPPAEPINFSLPLSALKKLTANPLLLLTPQGFTRLQHILDTYSDAKCRALAKELAATDTWQVPTLIRLKAMEFSDDPGFVSDSNLHYVLHDDRAVWNQVAQDFSTKLTPANRATLKQLFAAQLKLAKLFSDAGVKMALGTDFGGQWLVAGFSVHQEFDLLAQAGISPLKILQMTTLDGAKMLHREATMGTVEPGKNADLVVLDANPIASVQNLHKIDAVMHSGTYYSRDALDEMEQREIQP